VSPRFNIHRTHQVSVLRKTTVHALETCLRLAVVGADVLTDRAGLACVVGWHSQHLTAVKALLIGQLSPELVPTLVEDRPVQSGFGGNQLLEVAKTLPEIVGHDVSGHVVRAGKADRRYPMPDC